MVSMRDTAADVQPTCTFHCDDCNMIVQLRWNGVELDEDAIKLAIRVHMVQHE